MFAVAFLLALVFSSKIVDEINNDPTSTWTAKDYPPRIINQAKFRAMLMPAFTPKTKHVPLTVKAPLPSFDARTQWPNLYGVRDQGQCGSCWAFALAEEIGDRRVIAGCGVGDLSPQDFVSCDTTDLGCDGGYLDNENYWAQSHGITTEACIPYVSGDGHEPACPSTCNNGSSIVRYKVQNAQQIDVNTWYDTLPADGPFEVAFTVYSDFMNYAGGIYQHKSGFVEGGHAVLAIGWGTENGVDYWIIQNSWGADWGENGYFRIIRGTDDCGIEDQAWIADVIC